MDTKIISELHRNLVNNSVKISLLKPVVLEFFQCVASDLPDTGIDCSLVNPRICVRCEIRGDYLTNYVTSNEHSGPLVCQLLLIICIVVGILGMLTNTLTILILHKRQTLKAFDFLLLNMTYSDLCSCLSSIFTCIAPVLYLGEICQAGKLFLYWVYLSSLILQLFRTASFHLTVLITLERYLAIAYPIRARMWMTRTKSKIQVCCISVFIIVLCVPRYTSVYIGENIYSDKEGRYDVPSLANFEYIFLPSKMHTFWTDTLGKYFDYFLYLFEFWMLSVSLLVFNIWSARKVRESSFQRSQLNSSNEKEIRVARMFIPVVVIVLCCSVWMLITLVSTYVTNVFYREIWVILILVYQLNSTSNFFVYYIQSKEFRQETLTILSYCLCKLR